MLKRHSQFLKSLLFCIDLGLICACWVGAYYLRFSEIVEPATKGTRWYLHLGQLCITFIRSAGWITSEKSISSRFGGLPLCVGRPKGR